MKITPLEVQQQKFRVRFRGFDVTEVDAFLEKVADAMENVLRENAQQTDALEQANRQIQAYREREDVFRRAVLHSQKVLDGMKINAEKEAKLILAEAEVKAEKMLDAAYARSAEIREDIAELKRQRAKLEAQLQSVLDSHQKILEITAEHNESVDQEEEKIAFLKPA